MKLSCDDRGQLQILAIRGDLTSEHCDKLRCTVLQRIEKGACDYILDVSEMVSVDSAGLEMLLWMQEVCAEQLRQVRIASPHENVQDILRMTRLESRLPVDASVEQAEAGMHPEGWP